MHKIFDFTPSEPEVVVSRVLVHLHHAIDEFFPNASPASQRFAKTDFVGSDEPTLTQLMPSDLAAENLGAPHSDVQDKGLIGSDRGPRIYTISPHPEEANATKVELKTLASTRLGLKQRSFKQTLIGILTLILLSLIIYLFLSTK